MEIMNKTRSILIAAVVTLGLALPASAYSVFDTYSPSGNGSPVVKGECNDGTNFTVKYYPNNGQKYAIYSGFGSSAEAVIQSFCRNHGG
jgi:hypothetical protein